MDNMNNGDDPRREVTSLQLLICRLLLALQEQSKWVHTHVSSRRFFSLSQDNDWPLCALMINFILQKSSIEVGDPTFMIVLAVTV